MATTPNLGLPLYEGTDTAKLSTLLNGQSTALDTNIWALIGRAYGRGIISSQTVASSGTFSRLSLQSSSAILEGGVTLSASAFVIPVDGLYLIEASVMLPNASGSMSLAAYINGSLTGSPRLARQAMSASTTYPIYRGMETRLLSAGDQVAIHMWQNSGSSLTVDPDSSYLSVARLL